MPTASSIWTSFKSSGKRHLALKPEGKADAFLRKDVFYVDPKTPFGSFSCVIMASGRSKRFGSNKLMASFRDQPLIAHALKATEGIFVSRVVVTRHEDVASFCRERGVEVIYHDLPDRSDTVRLGLRSALDTKGCLFLPADQPLLRRETVASLVLCAADNPKAIWRAAHAGEPGSPVLFPRWSFSELYFLPQGCGGSHVIRTHVDRVRLLDVHDPREMMDVDTMEDLLRLSAKD